MARRVAQKHGLAPTSDFDAIRLLREKGIDPFQRANTLDLVMPESNTNAGAATSNVAQSGNTARDEEAVRQALGRIQLPQNHPKRQSTATRNRDGVAGRSRPRN